MSYQIRQSQVINTWPAGSIIDLPGISLIMLSPDDHPNDWGLEDHPNDKLKRNILNDPRLAAAFHVNQFAIPPIFDGRNTLGIYSIRFPNAQYCPKCGKIYFMEKHQGSEIYPGNSRSYNGLMKAFICSNLGCYQPKNIKNTPKLIPMRFVISTEEGFLDDFPWDWFVHVKCPGQRRRGNQLFYIQKGGSAGLQDIEIISKDNSGKIIAKRDLSEIFDQEIFTDICPIHGHYLHFVGGKLPKPWLGWKENHNSHEFTFIEEVINGIPSNGNLKNGDELTPLAKRKFPRTLQRGAGNIFFPIIYSGIRLPEECYNLNCPDMVRKYFSDTIELLTSDSPENYSAYSKENWKDYFVKKIELNPNHKLITYGYAKEEIKAFIINHFNKEISLDSRNLQFDLREQEFKAFTGNFIESNSVWFKKRKILSESLNNTFLDSFVDQIILLEKISVLKVYRGFTRIKPLMNEELIFSNDPDSLQPSQLEEYQRIQDARKDPINTKELPAIEVKGEGIFISFNNKILNEWTNGYPLIRVDTINRNLQNANVIFNQNISPVNKRYLLLHTLSHVILKELAEDCGYSLTSLAEIIYCSSDDVQNTDKEMNGILIYTTTSDAEGSLGGLVEKGEPRYLSELIKKAINKSRWCSSDPLCISAKNGQGFLGLNLAACYSCILLPETSCEKMNKYLDRAALIGTLENPEIGFFNFYK